MMTVEGTDSTVTVLGTARSAFTIVKKRVVEVKEVDPVAAATTTVAATMTTTEPQEGSSGSNPLPSSRSGRQWLRARVVDPEARDGGVATGGGARSQEAGGGFGDGSGTAAHPKAELKRGWRIWVFLFCSKIIFPCGQLNLAT
uniref:Uncharacterized protein n=1 Tax=Oryza barthii TaxID=65489 RepID=A0A0D3ENA3_9ORYZ